MEQSETVNLNLKVPISDIDYKKVSFDRIAEE